MVLQIVRLSFFSRPVSGLYIWAEILISFYGIRPWIPRKTNRSLITILLPIFASYKALRTSDQAQLTPWLIYWVVLSIFLLVESWTVFIVGWFPFYSWIRLFVLSYLVLPQTQGAKSLYFNYVEPFIASHEKQIEVFIGKLYEKSHEIGLGQVLGMAELVKTQVLGFRPSTTGDNTSRGQNTPSQSRPTTAARTTSAASYAQSLLSRFAMPSARSPAAAGDFYTMISGAFAAATSSTTSSAPASTATDTATKYFPTNVKTNADKQTFLSTQREKLAVLMRTLDREQRDLDLAYGNAPPTQQSSPSSPPPPSSPSYLTEEAPGGGGIQMGKSRSEHSFQNIDRHELEDDFHVDDANRHHDYHGIYNNGEDRRRSGRTSKSPVNKDRSASSGWSPSSWFGIGAGRGSQEGPGGRGGRDGDSSSRHDASSRNEMAQEVWDAVEGMSSAIERR